MRSPVISILMPVFNVESYVKTAIRSILAQTFGNWELLILDDGSTDQTAELVCDFQDSRIHFRKGGRNLGLSSRLNEGVQLASGSYIARMDGDDLAFPTRLQKQLNFLAANPEIDLVASSMLVFRNNGTIAGTRLVGAWSHAAITIRPWYALPMPHPTWMGKSAWFRNHPYRNDATRMEDFDLLYRAREDSCYATMPEILLGYREDRFDLAKNLESRRSTTRFFAQRFMAGDFFNGTAGYVSQLLRCGVDLLAVAAGCEAKLLSHRARPSADILTSQWKSIFSKSSIGS